MTQVNVKDNNNAKENTVEKTTNLEHKLRIFKQKVNRSGLPSELRKRKYYEKPGVERKNRIKESMRKNKKNKFNKDRD